MKRVLIVDDSSFMRRLIKNIITKNGYEVVGEAANGVEGVAKYTELKPDIVTMDVIMDEMNGLDALKRILENDPNATVVMVSSMGQDIIVKDAIRIGAKGYILKPYEERLIVETLNGLGD